jgi:hypothetical protein
VPGGASLLGMRSGRSVAAAMDCGVARQRASPSKVGPPWRGHFPPRTYATCAWKAQVRLRMCAFRLSLRKPIGRKFYHWDSEAHDAVRRKIWRPLSIYFKESLPGVAARLTASLTSFRSRLSSSESAITNSDESSAGRSWLVLITFRQLGPEELPTIAQSGKLVCATTSSSSHSSIHEEIVTR